MKDKGGFFYSTHMVEDTFPKFLLRQHQLKAMADAGGDSDREEKK
jgi:hypothetical protein